MTQSTKTEIFAGGQFGSAAATTGFIAKPELDANGHVTKQERIKGISEVRVAPVFPLA